MRIFAGLLSFVVASAGCDAEGPSDRDDVAATDDDTTNTDASDDDESDDDDDDPADGAGPVLTARPSENRGRTPTELHPCGNGAIDDGEQCDDGLANGDDRECTHACTLNDCDLDEHGVCSGHWPAADVDLYPCPATLGPGELCGAGVVTP